MLDEFSILIIISILRLYEFCRFTLHLYLYLSTPLIKLKIVITNKLLVQHLIFMDRSTSNKLGMIFCFENKILIIYKQLVQNLIFIYRILQKIFCFGILKNRIHHLTKVDI